MRSKVGPITLRERCSLVSRNRAEEIRTAERCGTESLDGFSSSCDGLEQPSKNRSVARRRHRQNGPDELWKNIIRFEV